MESALIDLYDCVNIGVREMLSLMSINRALMGLNQLRLQLFDFFYKCPPVIAVIPVKRDLILPTL